MPLLLQIVILVVAAPVVLAGLFMFGGKFKSQDYTKNNGGPSDGGSGIFDLGGDGGDGGD
jgi:hypothetical protein